MAMLLMAPGYKAPVKPENQALRRLSLCNECPQVTDLAKQLSDTPLSASVQGKFLGKENVTTIVLYPSNALILEWLLGATGWQVLIQLF